MARLIERRKGAGSQRMRKPLLLTLTHVSETVEFPRPDRNDARQNLWAKLPSGRYTITITGSFENTVARLERAANGGAFAWRPVRGVESFSNAGLSRWEVAAAHRYRLRIEPGDKAPNLRVEVRELP